MFGRRRHAAQAVAPTVEVAKTSTPLPRLAEEQIFELVHTRIAAAIGEGGEWVVRRRTPEDTDDLFRTVLAHQVALDVTSALQSAQLQLEAGEQLTVATLEGAVALRSAVHVEEGTVLGHSAVHADVDRDEVVVAVAQQAGRLAMSPASEDEADALPAVIAASERPEGDDSEHGPAHRHDEPQGDEEAVLDEDAIALQWEPAPITVWTDLKKPVTDSIALQLSRA